MIYLSERASACHGTLRRRLLFVKHRTTSVFSLQSIISISLSTRISVRAIKMLRDGDADCLFDSRNLVLAV